MLLAELVIIQQKRVDSTAPALARQRPDSLVSQQHGANSVERIRPVNLARQNDLHHPSGRRDLNHVVSSSKTSSVDSRGTTNHRPMRLETRVSSCTLSPHNEKVIRRLR